MDDKELGRMLRLEKVEENTFPEEKTKEVLQKEKHDQLKFRLKKRIRPEVFARMPEEIQDFLIDMDPTDMKEVYISTLLNLPWESEFKVPKIELMEAKTMLDSSHYAMLEVKEKVLRYMGLPEVPWKELRGSYAACRTSRSRQDIHCSFDCKGDGKTLCENITGRCFGCIISTRNTDSIQ
jgi:ATP-dependent Lon protease